MCAAAALAGCSRKPAPERAKPPLDLAPPSMSAVPSVGTYREYRDPNGLFSCQVPGAWTQDSDGATATPNVSFTLRQPAVAGGGAMDVFTLSIYYYAPGSAQFSSAGDFIRRNGPGAPNAQAGPVESVSLRAGPAKRWDLTVEAPGGPENMEAPKLEDTFVVLPAGKGFFVLDYTSPAESHSAHQAEFERLLDTFALVRGGGAPLASP